MVQGLFSSQTKRPKIILKICCFCAVFAVSLAAAPASDFAPANIQGSKAFLFSFSGLSNLGAGEFNGGIGAKYYLMDPFALRASFLLAIASESDPINAPSGSTGTDGSKSGSKFGLTIGGEYHFAKNRLSPYAGGELGFSSTSTTEKSKVINPAAQTVTDNKAGGTTIGGTSFIPGFRLSVAGIAGVEFFLTQEISLGAEYQFGFSTNSPYDQKVTNGTTTQTSENGGTFNLGTSSLGMLMLSFYF
jgi:opacity protein-like surface antigen